MSSTETTTNNSSPADGAPGLTHPSGLSGIAASRPGIVATPIAADRQRGLRLDEMVGALRTIPFGGIDDSTRNFALPPAVRATVSPLLNSLRWGAITFGIVFAAPKAFEGDLQVVLTLSVCIFVTCWRTAMPIRLASTRWIERMVAYTDTAILGAAIGASNGLASPFVYCLLAAIVVVAFGWGTLAGAVALVVGLVAMTVGLVSAQHDVILTSQQNLGALGAIVVATALATFARARLLDAEQRRASLAGRVGALAETNDLLTLLNSMARSLPTSLNVREAVEGVKRQVAQTFDAPIIALIEYVEGQDEWVPKLTDNCVVRPSMTSAELPRALAQATSITTPLLQPRLEPGHGVAEEARSGVYARLVARGKTVGLLAIEHTEPGRFGERDQRLLAGLADVVALTFDNARWFGRLRSLGAESERVRIARDLHDRLGQWLTYISYELERINMGTPDPELIKLHSDVVSALDELRETLRQLRTGVTEGEPLAKVASEIVDRLRQRSNLEINFTLLTPEEHLAVPVENEVLRIMQEALNNVEKHAKASRVDITWGIQNGVGQLTVKDDGKGFDQSSGIRDSAYGLVGMRERADVVGARLSIESRPGHGTLITVTTESTNEQDNT